MFHELIPSNLLAYNIFPRECDTTFIGTGYHNDSGFFVVGGVTFRPLQLYIYQLHMLLISSGSKQVSAHCYVERAGLGDFRPAIPLPAEALLPPCCPINFCVHFVVSFHTILERIYPCVMD